MIAAPPDSDARKSLDTAVSDGTLAGVSVQPVPELAVAGSDGVTILGSTGAVTAKVAIDGGAHGLALVSGVDDGTQLYVSSQDTSKDPQLSIIAVSGTAAKEGPVVTDTMPMPGALTKVVFDEASEMVEVLGTAPDGSGSTVYIVETHGKSVFADQRVPFAPVAWALDHNPDYPTANRGQLLTFASDGETGTLDIGDYPFAWRLPGVIMGVITVAFLFLLTRILFRRREIAVLVGLFALLDGMFFVQSRIAMNDVYTGAFIVAAYAVFAWLWLNPDKPRWAFWTLMPVVGVLLGLALASKWVAAYAIGALGILILARSALGRFVLILGMIGLTGVLGWMAMAVPSGSGAMGNLLFPLIMIALTLATVVVTVYHPIAWSDEEMWIAVAAPAGLGILVAVGSILVGKAGNTITVGPVRFTPLEVAFALIVVAGLAYVAFQVAGRLGFGPMAPPPEAGNPRALVPPASPPATGWLRPGWALGIPIVWMVGSLLAIPLVVYVAPVHPMGADRGSPAVRGLAAGPHGPDAGRPHRRDVPLPQRPHGPARRELAVVGVAAEPEAGVVLPGELRERHRGVDLRRRQRGPVVDGDPGDGLRRLPGVQAPEPAARADPRGLPVPVDLVGPHRPRRLPVPLLHEPAVPVHGARATSSGRCGTDPRAGRGCSRGSPRWAPCSRRSSCGSSASRCCATSPTSRRSTRDPRRATATPATSS